MSEGLMKMWIALTAMAFMFIAVFSIYLSRFKLKGFLKSITAVIAYFFMILAGIIIFFVVFSGPTSE
ncbi:MAG: DUF2768 domain-containing protein [Bacillaceae bacterium]|jgi:hypothetical protein|uniref:DUF2768 domain-containing protein n=2 Tax=Aeribacillus TaxID=1055323 RepID=A0A161Y2K5_9BACI|nr:MULTISPECIES: DUF2768 domain-containing protein [Aeribacillus]AXI40030.1 DUF2768 domain-containing protein [Bacillaceae bacterium ZC4]REJ17386.1 MAG: DUF2768 domain-containing protein [Bacillaceae bacterium]ASS91753.1 hypothetical protein AP3564_17245 [Aeribacillus pallidus]KZM52710.1 hypothetical protein A3Q35_03890 [Aeribacillus pallidus]KZN95862.1 hypothetical protein AZI98_12390 [Aeribacillus pallidus]